MKYSNKFDIEFYIFGYTILALVANENIKTLKKSNKA